MSGLLELAERVEKASGPDRELDVAIGLTGRFYVAEPRYPGAEPMIGYVEEDGSRVEPGTGAQDSLVPRYTASLDTAMTLVVEGWILIELRNVGPDNWYAGLARWQSETTETEAFAATGPLALTAACLRARASQDQSS